MTFAGDIPGPRYLRWQLALIAVLFLATAPAQEKKLAVYSPLANYAVAVVDRDGKEYVGLVDVLEPLGKVTANAEGKKWRLRFTPSGRTSEIEAQFALGSTEAKVRGKIVELAAPFLLETARGLIPLHSLPTLLAYYYSPIDLHEAAHRLFVAASVVHYTAEIRKTPERLVLSFSAPVNPFVATEPGRLRMVFTREPVVSTTPLEKLDDPTITGLSFSETNGAAELAISGNAPLFASFSNAGRTITITAAPQPAQNEPPQPPATLPAATAVATAPKFQVAIDPGHGGTDTGAALGELPEKDFTLQLARRLRTELESRGIATLLLRDGDTNMGQTQRALDANNASPAVYVSLHGTSAGAGVRVFTAGLQPAPRKSGRFLAWDTAQSAYVEKSSAFAQAVVDELGRRQIPAGHLAVPVRPLDQVATVAVAVEVAPPPKDAQGFASPVYQQAISSAIVSAVTTLRLRGESPQ